MIIENTKISPNRSVKATPPYGGSGFFMMSNKAAGYLEPDKETIKKLGFIRTLCFECPDINDMIANEEKIMFSGMARFLQQYRDGQKNELNLSPVKETVLNVNGSDVKFIEYETAKEGDFVKVCTNDHDLGVAAEYVWFQNKYIDAVCMQQYLKKIKLNGNKTSVDILTIKINNGFFKDIYFDISDMMENLKNIVLEK
jgi:hypothetical protein